jgi:hypothetical protein
MATEKQLAANRRNAAKSTGPKSAAGKEVARMNALKHGFQAEQVVIPGEDPEEFEALLKGLDEHFQPIGSLEHVLVDRITYCTWRLRRANLIEIAIMRREHCELESKRARVEMQRTRRNMNTIASAFDSDLDGDDSEEEESNVTHTLPADKAEALWRDYRIAEEAHNQAEEAHDRAEEELESFSCEIDMVFHRSTNRLENLSRYETTIERQLRNAMQDLERIQAARKAEAAEAATVIDVTDIKEEEA